MNPVSLFAKDMTPVRKLLALKAMTGESAVLVEDTATGNPATFETDVAKALVKCEVAFTPVQAGTGDPSPSNVRNISGWTGITVYRSGEDTSNPATFPVTWEAKAGTVYGGTVDLVTGLMTVTHSAYIVDGNNGLISSLTLSEDTGKIRVWFGLTKSSSAEGYSNILCYPNNPICNKMVYTELNYSGHYNPSIGQTFEFGNATSYVNSLWCWLPYGGSDGVQGNTVNDVKNYLTANPMVFVGELQIPFTVQLDPVTIKTLKGVNTVWSDANGDCDITFKKKA